MYGGGTVLRLVTPTQCLIEELDINQEGFMKTAILILTTILIASPVFAKTVVVKPHVTKQGTYKPTSYRTSPNSTKIDNFSSKPNSNPYTGKKGNVDPFKR